LTTTTDDLDDASQLSSRIAQRLVSVLGVNVSSPSLAKIPRRPICLFALQYIKGNVRLYATSRSIIQIERDARPSTNHHHHHHARSLYVLRHVIFEYVEIMNVMTVNAWLWECSIVIRISELLKWDTNTSSIQTLRDELDNATANESRTATLFE